MLASCFYFFFYFFAPGVGDGVEDERGLGTWLTATLAFSYWFDFQRLSFSARTGPNFVATPSCSVRLIHRSMPHRAHPTWPRSLPLPPQPLHNPPTRALFACFARSCPKKGLSVLLRRVGPGLVRSTRDFGSIPLRGTLTPPFPRDNRRRWRQRWQRRQR